MTLTVLLPDECLFEGSVTKIVADGVDGRRGFLPKHIDFVLPLSTGVVSCRLSDGSERFFAVHRGVLVKKGPEVTIATPAATVATSMDALPAGVLQSFTDEDEQERISRGAMARLETVLLREFMDMAR